MEEQKRAESAFFLICSVMAVMGRPARQKIALGVIEALDGDIFCEGDVLNVGRQIFQHGDADICHGEFIINYECFKFLIGFDLSDLCEYVSRFGSSSLDIARMLRDEMRCLHPLADVTDHRARTRLQNLVQRVAHHEDVEDAESGARAEVRLKSITMLSSFIIGFDLPGSSQRDPEAAIHCLRHLPAVAPRGEEPWTGGSQPQAGCCQVTACPGNHRQKKESGAEVSFTFTAPEKVATQVKKTVTAPGKVRSDRHQIQGRDRDEACNEGSGQEAGRHLLSKKDQEDSSRPGGKIPRKASGSAETDGKPSAKEAVPGVTSRKGSTGSASRRPPAASCPGSPCTAATCCPGGPPAASTSCPGSRTGGHSGSQPAAIPGARTGRS